MGWMGGDGSSSSASPHTSPPSQGESPTYGRKRKITRTRTGCQTCRDRKVKCGEEKPECINCQRTNHVSLCDVPRLTLDLSWICSSYGIQVLSQVAQGEQFRRGHGK